MKRVKMRTGTVRDMGRRFVDAWKRAQAGETVSETNLTFVDLESLLSTLTPKRLELIKHIHSKGPLYIKNAADQLGRDYKNIYQDVQALLAAGLLIKIDDRIAAPWDEVQASLTLR